MSDLSKLKIAMCQIEPVQGFPSSYETSLRQLTTRVKLTGADLAIFPAPSKDALPRLVAMNGSILLEEEGRATLSAEGELYHIALGSAQDGCDFAVVSNWEPWTLGSASQEATSAGIACPTVISNPIGIKNADKRVVVFDGASREGA